MFHHFVHQTSSDLNKTTNNLHFVRYVSMVTICLHGNDMSPWQRYVSMATICFHRNDNNSQHRAMGSVGNILLALECSCKKYNRIGVKSL